jgi:hypothetical protein
MSFDSLTNRGEFFSNHYLDAIIAGDLGDLRRRWDETEAAHKDTGRSRLRGLGAPFFAARARATEAGGATRVDAVRTLNTLVLEALGFTVERRTLDLVHTTVDELRVPLASSVDTGSGLLLVALDAGLADDVDDLFDSSLDAGVQLFDPLTKVGEKRLVRCPADAVGDVFATDDPPRWVMVVAGRIVLLAERAKWAEGRFLAVDLDAALERNDIRKAGEIETIAALFSTDVVVPDEGQAVIDELSDKSQKHAVGVSKDLREGIRQSIEILANEVIEQRLELSRRRHDTRYAGDAVDPRELTRQCLRYLYRLLVLLYAESRPELGIVPVDDEVYLGGYSLDRLRELTLVQLDTDDARNGSHLDQSLRGLFALVNDGNHAEAANALFASEYHDVLESREDYLQFPGLDALLFAPKSTELLDAVTLRNAALQQVLRLLMVSPEGKGKGKRANRGFISYAQLGINQLGAVYEGLMAYTGFFAADDVYEVAKDGDPSGGTWVVPVSKADEYPDNVFVSRTDPLTGRSDRVLHPKGSFVFRLSGRDRQRSASYYTPEVLTRCVVKHALAELLGLDDYAPENGSSGITEARQILDLTICEPALGSGAFLNEAINQLSVEYLRRRQAELGETLDPERYLRELQKVKAHFALHQSYGVDLNATAVELAEVSLWLNCMHPGLKAPWFGLQLRRGNSLVGCRRATWRRTQLNARPWAQTAKGKRQPPADRPLAEPLESNEIHHFLLPGHGWAAVADRSEAKEFRPDRAKGLREWRKSILASPGPSDAVRLTALAAGVERLWLAAPERIRLTKQALRRPIDVWGAEPLTTSQPASREAAIKALDHPDSELGRLRTVMDAWVGLWFWELDTEVALPTWGEWLKALEDLVYPDGSTGSTGQLDMLTDLPALLEADERTVASRPTVAELRTKHEWLGVAVDLARREGAWHWELEFAPEFAKGGFDLQVGNPPWVRPRWEEHLVLAELDPWWGVTEQSAERTRKSRRANNLDNEAAVGTYVSEVGSAEGLTELLGSAVLRPVLAGMQTNLFMVFMDMSWRNARVSGMVGLLHPESHFTDPNGASLRAAAYGHLRRHFQFLNGLFLFEDINDKTVFGIQVYGDRAAPTFLQLSYLQHPDLVDESLGHDGSGDAPGIQYEDGGWDLRPHASRVVTVTEEVLADWARLFDEPGTPPEEARLLRPVTQADLDALSVLADQPVRLADHDYHWSSGWHEKGAKTDGLIEWDTRIPDSWHDVILQGPHFTIATPFAKQPNENCKHNQDYSDWDLETLPEHVVPRTNYQRACDRDPYTASLDHWKGRPCNTYWRVVYRAMTQPGLERSLHAAVVPPGPMHVNAVHALGFDALSEGVDFAALWVALPYDYLVKVIAKSNIQDTAVTRSPFPQVSGLTEAARLRYLRLNCLTGDYLQMWESLCDSRWHKDSWTLPHATVHLGDVDTMWTMATPLRRDVDRRQGLVELDALAALMLGLSAEQLSAMYRTQFPVLRKYEYSMAFDAEGRRICKHHQSAGYRQLRLQNQAKAGELPPFWRSVWSLYEQWEDDPDSVDWLGHYQPPFYRPNREHEMTTAYNEFQRRLDAGEYG